MLMRTNISNDVSKDSPIQPMFMSFVTISSSTLMSLFKGHITCHSFTPIWSHCTSIFFLRSKRSTSGLIHTGSGAKKTGKNPQEKVQM